MELSDWTRDVMNEQRVFIGQSIVMNAARRAVIGGKSAAMNDGNECDRFKSVVD